MKTTVAVVNKDSFAAAIDSIGGIDIAVLDGT